MLSATLHGIHACALYQHAVGGDTGAFDARVLAGAFRTKGARPLLMPAAATAPSDSLRGIG
jgi:hypothetical protein